MILSQLLQIVTDIALGAILFFLVLIGRENRKMVAPSKENRRIVMMHLDAHKVRMDALEAQIAELARTR